MTMDMDVATEADGGVLVEVVGELAFDALDTTAAGVDGVSSLCLPALATPAIATMPTTTPEIHGHFLFREREGCVTTSPRESKDVQVL